MLPDKRLIRCLYTRIRSARFMKPSMKCAGAYRTTRAGRKARSRTLRRWLRVSGKEIFPDRGYGFLETADGRDIYFNQASVLDGHFDRLRVGTRVQFAEESGDKGPQASTLKVIHPRKQAQTAAAVDVLPRKKVAVKSQR